MRLICKNCGSKFEVVSNPTPRTYGQMIVRKGTYLYPKLCAACWYKAKNFKGMKGKRSMSYPGMHIKQTRSIFSSVSASAQKIIDRKEREMDRLKKVIKAVSQKNAKLDDENAILKSMKKRLRRKR